MNSRNFKRFKAQERKTAKDPDNNGKEKQYIMKHGKKLSPRQRKIISEIKGRRAS